MSDQLVLNDRISIEGRDGSIGAYISRPMHLPAPAVIILQEVFGVNADIRQHCDEMAEWGFLAVAPDLYWRQEIGVDLDAKTEGDFQRAVDLYQAYDRTAGVRDIEDAIGAVTKLPECTGKVGLLGYCFGGLMVFLAAVRTEIDAGVAFHGGDTEQYLGEAASLNAPLLMHLAEEDEYISKEAQAAIKASLANRPGAVIYSYPGQYHAFSRHNGEHYDAEAAALSNARTREFLKRHLS